MNPSYFRIKIPLDDAKIRFCEWLKIPKPTEYLDVDIMDSVSLSCNESGNWRGDSLFIYQSEDWTVFEDLSGGFGTIAASNWVEFSQENSFVFAGYNDAIPYGELIVIEGKEIIKEFIEIPNEPEVNVNVNSFEGIYVAIKSWIDVASFVDDDELVFSEKGCLWVIER